MYDVEQFEEMSERLLTKMQELVFKKKYPRLHIPLECNPEITRLLFMQFLRTGAAIAAESSEMCGLFL